MKSSGRFVAASRCKSQARCQRPQLVPQRLRCGDQQVAQLAEAGASGGDGAFTGGDQRLQRLALAAGTRRRRPFACEDAARGTDRVERIALAASTP